MGDYNTGIKVLSYIKYGAPNRSWFTAFAQRRGIAELIKWLSSDKATVEKPLIDYTYREPVPDIPAKELLRKLESDTQSTK